MDIRFLNSADGLTAFSVGMASANLPNVARMLPAGVAFDAAAAAMVALVREMSTRQWHPQTSERFMADIPYLLRRLHDDVWMVPLEEHDEARERSACYRHGLSRAAELVLKLPFIQEDVPSAAYRVDHYRGFSMTCGLGEHHGLEVACHSRQCGPRLTQMLSAVGDLTRDRTLNAYDRVAHHQPMYGVAGHVLWPVGHLQATDSHPNVQLLEALPLFPDELESFRQSDANQTAWLNQRHERRDVHVIRERWDGVFAWQA